MLWRIDDEVYRRWRRISQRLPSSLVELAAMTGLGVFFALMVGAGMLGIPGDELFWAALYGAAVAVVAWLVARVIHRRRRSRR